MMGSGENMERGKVIFKRKEKSMRKNEAKLLVWREGKEHIKQWTDKVDAKDVHSFANSLSCSLSFYLSSFSISYLILPVK